MRKYIVLIVLCCAASAFAAVTVTLTVPDAAVVTVLEAFNTLTNKHITLQVRGSMDQPDGSDFHGSWDFRIAPKDPNETNVAFSKRCTAELIRACVRLTEQAKDEKRYRDEISAVAPVDVNVPDSVIQ